MAKETTKILKPAFDRKEGKGVDRSSLENIVGGWNPVFCLEMIK
jgi:hypothetical protein